MRIFLFRHAEKMGAGPNAPLSHYGEQQAKMLWELVQDRQIEPPTSLRSSPRLRAVQTLMPLSQEIGLDIQIQEDLNFRSTSETSDRFTERVKNYLETISHGTGVVYIATHFDWIETAMGLIPCDRDLFQPQFQNWGPAQFMDFEVSKENWSLQSFGTVKIRG